MSIPGNPNDQKKKECFTKQPISSWRHIGTTLTLIFGWDWGSRYVLRQPNTPNCLVFKPSRLRCRLRRWVTCQCAVRGAGRKEEWAPLTCQGNDMVKLKAPVSTSLQYKVQWHPTPFAAFLRHFPPPFAA